MAMTELENAFFDFQAIVVEGGFQKALIDATTILAEWISSDTADWIANVLGGAFALAAENLGLLATAAGAWLAIMVVPKIIAVARAMNIFALSVSTATGTVRGLSAALLLLQANWVSIAIGAAVIGLAALAGAFDDTETTASRLAETQAQLNGTIGASITDLDELAAAYRKASDEAQRLEDIRLSQVLRDLTDQMAKAKDEFGDIVDELFVPFRFGRSYFEP